MSGYVYWARDKELNIVKIGASKNPPTRIKHVRGELELVEQWATDTPYDDEAAIHELLGDRRIAGEWFHLRDKDLEKVRKFFASPRHYKKPKETVCPRPHCGYVWTPKVAKPKACPECKHRLKGKWIELSDAAISSEGGEDAGHD